MAKDGTRRGGARVGAGRKPKALTDKINEGESPEPPFICYLLPNTNNFSADGSH